MIVSDANNHVYLDEGIILYSKGDARFNPELKIRYKIEPEEKLIRLYDVPRFLTYQEKEYIYYIEGALYGQWYFSDKKLPIIKEEFEDEQGRTAIKIKWNSTYSGQFDLWYGDESGPLFDYKKTIVVESLF